MIKNYFNIYFQKNKPLIATLWEIFITGMILYFLKSIIESLVNDKRVS